MIVDTFFLRYWLWLLFICFDCALMTYLIVNSVLILHARKCKYRNTNASSVSNQSSRSKHSLIYSCLQFFDEKTLDHDWLIDSFDSQYFCDCWFSSTGLIRFIQSIMSMCSVYWLNDVRLIKLSDEWSICLMWVRWFHTNLFGMGW